MAHILLSMLSERSVDLAIKRLKLPKDVLRSLYDSVFISPEVRKPVLAYANNELNEHLTRYKLRMVKERILENNGNDGNNGRKTKKDEDSLKSSTYIH